MLPRPGPGCSLWTAVLTLVLVLDDLLLLHEAAAFAPWAGALVAAAYGLAFLRFVVRFRDVILRDLDVGLLLLAVGSLGVSLVTDLLVAPTQSSVLVEDGAKLLGLVAWSAFGLRTALFALGHSQGDVRARVRIRAQVRRPRRAPPTARTPHCRVRTGQPRHPLAQLPAEPASVTPTSVRWKFWNERDAVGPRCPWYRFAYSAEP